MRRAWVTWRDALCLLTIIAMVARNHYNARATRDVGPDDEAWYVAGGLLFGKPGFPNGLDGWPIPELGPIHGLTYLLLSKIYRAPLELYFAAWHLRTTLLALTIFVLARRMRAPWWQALAGSFFFVNCAIADVWPFPMHTATLVILLGLVVTSFARTTTSALGIATITLAFAGFTRPDLLSAYGVAVAVFAVFAIREARITNASGWRRGLEASAWIGATILPGAALFALFGNPLGGTRSWFAFAQHYTLALFQDQGNQLDPWANWRETVARDFPGATSTLEALRANPPAFLTHIGRNLVRYPRNALMATFPTLSASKIVETMLWLGVLALAAVQIYRIASERSRSPTKSATIFVFWCSFVPFTISTILVHPRLHYFVAVVVLALTLVFGHPLPRLASRWQHVRSSPVVAIVACVLAVTLTASKGEAATLMEWLTQSPSKHCIEGRQAVSARLREHGLKNDLVVLEYQWGTCLYAGYSCTSYQRWDKWMPFDQFITERHIEVVIFDESMRRDVRFIGDPHVADFLEHPESHGFYLERVPNTDVRIGIRADLVARPPH